MVKDELPLASDDAEESHNRWLDMQSAYAEYVRASDALDSTYESGNAPSGGVNLRGAILEGRHRCAFERYVDARMAFLESQFDEIARPEGADPAQPAGAGQDSSRGKWLSLANCRLLLEGLAILLLCTTAFSLVRAQKQVRDLETARQDLETTIKQTRDALGTLGQQVKTLASMRESAVERVRNIRPENKPARTASWRKASIKGRTDRQLKPRFTQQLQAKAHPTFYPPAANRSQRPKSYKSDPALPEARQSTRAGVKLPWWWPGASAPGDSRF